MSDWASYRFEYTIRRTREGDIDSLLKTGLFTGHDPSDGSGQEVSKRSRFESGRVGSAQEGFKFNGSP